MPTFTNSVNGTAGAATSYTSAIRWAYLLVENTGTTGILWVRTDGSAAAAADGSYSIAPGQSLVVANDLPLWSQAASVIPAGSYPAGNVVGSGTPPEIQPYGGSLYGQTANPGTSISVFSAATPTFTISGTG